MSADARETEAVSGSAADAGRRSWVGESATLTWRWVRSLVGSLVLFGVVGAVLAGVGVMVVPGGVGMRTGFGAVVMIVCGVLGVSLGVQHAFAMTAVEAVRRFRLCELLVQRLFDRLAAEPDAGSAQTAVAAGQLVSLAEAEARLRRCVRFLDPEVSRRGRFTRFVLRRVHARLLRLIERYTLAELRGADGGNGAIDLAIVREHVAGRIDRMVEDRLAGTTRATIRSAAVAVVVMSVLGVAGMRYLGGEAGGPSAATAPATMAVEGE